MRFSGGCIYARLFDIKSLVLTTMKETNLKQVLSLAAALWAGSFVAGVAAETPQQRAAELADVIELTLPTSAGPHPLAILLPGCLSWYPHHARWRDALLVRGYAVLHVDSFAARGLAGRRTLERLVCSGAQLHGDERAGDVMAVLESLHQRNDLNLAQTVIFGWSHGGWSAMDLLSRVTAGMLPTNLTAPANLEGIDFRAAFIFYPYCGPGSLDGTDGYPAHTRTLMFHGTRDVITNPQQCAARARALATAGATIEFFSMTGSRHWFDNHTEPAAFDAAATARAGAAIEAALADLEHTRAAP